MSFDPEFAFARVFGRMDEPERRLLLLAVQSDEGRRDYAAWLAARDDPRAEVLSLELQLRDHDDPQAAKELQTRLSTIDREWWWLLQTSRIHNCGAATSKPPKVRFRLQCTQEWAGLQPTGDPNVRHCEKCERQVYRCSNEQQANARALAGECIAVAPEMARAQATDGPAMFVGRPDFVAMWAERLFSGLS